MGRPRPQPSPTDRYARRIAAAVANGRRPELAPDLRLYLESSPGEIFAAFEGMARHMPPAGEDAELAVGYLCLLQGLLEHLRYRADRGYDDALRLVTDFQTAIAARVETGEIDRHLLAHVGVALHEAKLPVSAAFAAAAAARSPATDAGAPLPDDIGGAIGRIVEGCGGDPFALVGSLAQAGHVQPADARAALAAALACGGNADASAAAVLFLLDPDSVVRRAVARALERIAPSLSPTDLRRLIAVRNWRPESERADVDAVIRTSRAAGTDCAPWPAGGAEAIHATAIDGAEAQGFLLVSPAGRRRRLSSILIKGGIADAWSAEPESRRRIEATLADADAPMLPVSRAYLDRLVAHALAVGIEKGEVPPFGLLQVAETIGGADWQPMRMEFGETLAGLIGELPTEMRDTRAVETLLRRSGELADLELVAESWFEDGPDIAELVAGARGAKPAKLAAYLLQVAIAQRRGKWADLILRTALWMREAPSDDDLCWRELAIVAKAVADGRDMTEIGLMRDIALRTIAVQRDAVHL
jgi:hypothetical protein